MLNRLGVAGRLIGPLVAPGTSSLLARSIQASCLSLSPSSSPSLFSTAAAHVPPTPPIFSSKEMLIKNLPPDVGHLEVRALLAPYGETRKVHILRKGKTEVIALVKMRNSDDARRIMADAVEFKIAVKGRPLIFNESRKASPSRDPLLSSPPAAEPPPPPAPPASPEQSSPDQSSPDSKGSTVAPLPKPPPRAKGPSKRIAAPAAEPPPPPAPPASPEQSSPEQSSPDSEGSTVAPLPKPPPRAKGPSKRIAAPADESPPPPAPPAPRPDDGTTTTTTTTTTAAAGEGGAASVASVASRPKPARRASGKAKSAKNEAGRRDESPGTSAAQGAAVTPSLSDEEREKALLWIEQKRAYQALFKSTRRSSRYSSPSPLTLPGASSSSLRSFSTSSTPAPASSSRTATQRRLLSKTPLTVTPNAARRLKQLLEQSSSSSPSSSSDGSAVAAAAAVGVRIGVRRRGCNGLSFTMNYVLDNAEDSKKVAKDEVVFGTAEAEGGGEGAKVKVFVDPQALFNIVGTVMDWKEDDVASEFTFNNPNAKGNCGCGESFNV